MAREAREAREASGFHGEWWWREQMEKIGKMRWLARGKVGEGEKRVGGGRET